jgi:NADH-ubiquinone oxidoreductase chain 5
MVSLFFGRFVGSRGAAVITTSCVFLSFIASLIAFYEVAFKYGPCYVAGGPWISSEMLDANWGLLFDSLTVVMLVVITTVSTLVHLYSISYMAGANHLPRFMSYLSIFTFFMLILVTGDNFIQLFLGWEGVGLASYLLINFWYTRLQANKAAIKAMLVNRVGDFGLALGIMGCFSIFASVDYSTIFACATPCNDATNSQLARIFFFNAEFDAITIVCILLFIGAVGKSAQIGLHTWLPDAMEGPTPVSALIHAATMVTAGVFMIARCSPLFEYANNTLPVLVTFVGAMTAFFAATTGVFQNDLKRVIAFSTCSQLGYMILACGLGATSVGVFHLMNHAFFKALLFLSAGTVIHAMSDEQDMRKFGGLVITHPFTYAMMLIGSLSLIGFPFNTGFYSKDVILELANSKHTITANFAFWLASISVFFTSYYSFRLLFLTFLSPSNRGPIGYLNKENSLHHDVDFNMAFVKVPLALGSIFVGYLAKDMMIGPGTDFWGNAISLGTGQLPSEPSEAEYEFTVPVFIRFMPLFLSLCGALLAAFTQIKPISIIKASSTFQENSWQATQFARLRSVAASIKRGLYTFLNKRWLFDKVYNEFICNAALWFGYYVSFKTLDKGVFEILGPLGLQRITPALSGRLSLIQSGYVAHYASIMLISCVVLLATFWLSKQGSGDVRIFFILACSLLAS